MKLYHGTRESTAIQALERGLFTRATSAQASNWPKAESHPELVYLTTAYAPYFAATAVGLTNERYAVVEVDGDKLDQELFRPDEDFLEQASRGQQVRGMRAKTMLGRTRWFRDRIDEFSHLWDKSLSVMGVAAYRGDIPIEAITGISLFDPRSNMYVATMCVDPLITILNYRYVGQKYVQLTNWFFKRDIDVETLLFGAKIAGESEGLQEIVAQGARHLALTEGLELLTTLNVK